MRSIDEIIDDLSQSSEERFEQDRVILSYSQFLEQVQENPYSLTRNSAQYIADMMDYFGSEEVLTCGVPCRRFKVFDGPEDGGDYATIGQEVTQHALYRTLREFVQRRQNDKMILLHGPNGSSKTTLVAGLMRGLEIYSQVPEGALFRFSWVFSEAGDQGEKLGFNPVVSDENIDTFAFLEAERISAKIPSDLHDHPIFLLPQSQRMEFLTDALKNSSEAEQESFVETRMVLEGDLSPKFRSIYDALLKAYRGDWKKLIRHVQVERYSIRRQYRRGAVTIEPQSNIDAHSRQIGHATMKGLPPILQNETMFEAQGDLVDANRGMVEYSDFFKRPIEANKYLLTTAETGVINLPSYTARLDLVLIGTSNENYLSAFRRDPLFPSFQGRLELVGVPYLLEFDKEAQIYGRHFDLMPSEIHVAPHTADIAGLWSVLTRLMQSSGQFKNSDLSAIVGALSPIEKAKLYNDGTVPLHLSADHKNLLRQHIADLRREYDNHECEFEGTWDAAYEGRRGCSPREMITMLSEIAIHPPGNSLTPLLVLRKLPELIKDTSRYQFLRLKQSKNGYHDCKSFVDVARTEYLRLLTHDVEDAAELVDEGEYSRLFSTYFLHVRAFKTNEKIEDPSSGKMMDPDRQLMKRMEELLQCEKSAEDFRSSLMTRAAAFKISNRDSAIVYEEVFADLYQQLKSNVFREGLKKVEQLLTDVFILEGAIPGNIDEEAKSAAESFCDRMISSFGYNEFSLKEALEFLRKNIQDLY
ncbi:MAG: serine protein kinase [Planctomycetota bacterium]|jgi:serine protein kinase